MSEGQYELDQQRIDNAAVAEAMAVQRIEPAPPNVVPITPQDARNTSIAHTLDAAYAKASTLQLSPEESARLMADFDDCDIRAGARGKENLIYLEHAAVRRRLMEVFGPGGWAIINRRSWLDEGGGWMYADIVLICRGCFVGESIGANRYGKGNSMVNYADAVKGAESDALGRIAGTALGVGLQLWSRGFCEAWHQRNAAGTPKLGWVASGRVTTSTPRPPQQNAPQANVERIKRHVAAGEFEQGSAERKPAAPADVLQKSASPKTREWAVLELNKDLGAIHWFLVGKGWITDAQEELDWPLEHVPTSRQALAVLADEIRSALPKSESPIVVDEHTLPPEIGSQIITVPRRGMKRAEYLQNPDTIQSLYSAMKNGDADAQKRLWGMVKGWTPEPYVDANQKKWPVKQEDFDCRVALDLFADYMAQKGETGA
jgi:hypothetical protein